MFATMRRAGLATVQFYYHYIYESSCHKTFFVFGIPAVQIINFAEKERSDLIVVGAHEGSGINRLRLGSIAHKVIRSTARPVLTRLQQNPKEKHE